MLKAKIKRKGHSVTVTERNHDWMVKVKGWAPFESIHQEEQHFLVGNGAGQVKSLTFQDAVFKAADRLIHNIDEYAARRETRESADTWMKEHAVDEAS